MKKTVALLFSVMMLFGSVICTASACDIPQIFELKYRYLEPQEMEDHPLAKLAMDIVVRPGKDEDVIDNIKFFSTFDEVLNLVRVYAQVDDRVITGRLIVVMDQGEDFKEPIKGWNL